MRCRWTRYDRMTTSSTRQSTKFLFYSSLFHYGSHPKIYIFLVIILNNKFYKMEKILIPNCTINSKGSHFLKNNNIIFINPIIYMFILQRSIGTIHGVQYLSDFFFKQNNIKQQKKNQQNNEKQMKMDS